MYTDSPDYTDEARLAELEGTVWVAAVIGTDGRVRDLQVTRSIGLDLERKAMDAMRHWQFQPGRYEGKEVDTFVVLPVTFVLPSKHSRWHLVGVAFDADDGASRPQFRSVTYPPGAGVSRRAIDHAQVVSAVGRQGIVTLSFMINEHGRPVQFKVESASDDRWGPEAIDFLQMWEFAPAVRNGAPISAGCKLTLVWGERNLSLELLRDISGRVNR
jgi:TonB family protein